MSNCERILKGSSLVASCTLKTNMKNCGSASSSSKNMGQLVDNITSLWLGTKTLVVQKNAKDGCQHFSMGQYVADTLENDEKACNPFEEKIYEETHDVLEPQGTSRRLTAQLSTLKLCPSIEQKASRGATEGEGITAPIDREIQDNNPLEELTRVATLLKEKESAEENVIIKTPTKLNDNVQPLKNCCRGHPDGQVNVTQRKTRFTRQELARPEETENAKRGSPFSQDTEVISRKRLKVTGESSCPYQDKQKGMFRRSGTGPNPLLRHISEKFAARYMTEPFTPTLKPKTGVKRL